ncbi:MAG: radical SAM protein [Holophagales bacterium]|nr:radical SAM protein [Holophagales bacterium]
MKPLTLVMDITERCNLRCVMCYFSSIDRLRFPPFDRQLSENGNMPVEVFEEIAERFFPRAWRVSLGCAAEPLIHSKFADLVRIAGRYGVRDLWFPTNLLALTEPKAEAIVEAGVSKVAISMDGTEKELYERIRVGGKWELFLKRLELLERVRRGSGTRTRIIYTWMQSNKHDLRRLPAFAQEHGVSDLDVRFVTPTTGVDNTPELLETEDRAWLDDELARVAEDAVNRGLRLAYYPEFQTPADGSRNPMKRLGRALWRVRAGLYRPEYFRYRWHKQREGCAYPKRTYVIRPNGAVSPCIFWEREPLGFLPHESVETIDERIAEVSEGLRCGKPIGTCRTCEIRRDAFYQPLRPASSTEPLDAVTVAREP